MIFLPKNVADAIDSCWTHCSTTDPTAIKSMSLNDWTNLSTSCPTEYPILKDYAQTNPVNYMQALVDGYEIDFNSTLSYNFGGVELSFSQDILNKNYTSNNPILIQIGSAYENLTIEDATSISININSLLQELNKVRN